MEALLASLSTAAQSSWQFIGGGVQILVDGGGQAGTALVNVSTQLTTGLIQGIHNIFLLG